MVYDLRYRLFNHLQSLGLHHHITTSTSDAVYRVDVDAYSIENLVMSGIFPLATSFITLFVMFSILAYKDLTIALAVARGRAVSVFLPALLHGDAGQPRGARQGARVEAARAAVRDVFGDAAGQELRPRAVRSRAVRRAPARRRCRRGSPSPGSSRCSRSSSAPSPSSAPALVVVVGGMHVMRGELTVGALTVVISYLGAVYGPLSSIAHTTGQLQGAIAGARRVRAMFALVPETVEAPDAVEAANVARRDPLRGCRLLVPRRHGRPARHRLHGEARRADCARRPHRRRQDHARQPDSALLRSDGRPRARSTAWTSGTTASDRCASASPSCCRIRCCSPARLPTTCATAGSTPRADEIEDAARAAHAHEFISHLREGLRHGNRRSRRRPVGRRAPAAERRARDPQERADSDPRRADLVARRDFRGDRLFGAAPAARRPHDDRHRAPAVDRPRRRLHPGPRRRPDRRQGAPRRSAGEQPALPADVRAVVGRQVARRSRERRRADPGGTELILSCCHPAPPAPPALPALPAMKILFAGIIARYPFGGVTWCSLMYLLGLRALGHEVFYIEDTGECVYDPVQNTRSTDPVLRHLLYSPARSSRSASATAGRSSTTTAPITAAARTTSGGSAPTPICSSISRADRGSGATSTRAFHARRSSTPTRRSRSSPLPRPSRGTSSSFSASIACSRSAPTSARRPRRFRPARSRGTRPGSPSPSTTGARRSSRRDRFTSVMTWQIESFTDVGGNKDQEFVRVHRPAVADVAAVRAGDQRAAAPAARTRLGDGRRDGRLALAVGLPRRSSSESRAEFGVAKHTYVATRSGWFSDRTECYLASGRPALVQDTGWTAHLPHGEGLLAFSTPDEALAGIDRINGDYARHARARRRDRARAFRRRAACFRGCSTRRAHERSALRIAHVAPVATTIPPPQVGIGRVDDLAAHRRAGRARPRRDAVRDRRLDHLGHAHRHLHARLLARREHVAVGAVRDAESRRGRRARARVRHHPLRGGVLPDVARVHAAVADADRADAAPFAERRRSGAVVALSRSAVRRHLERAGAAARRRSTSSPRCCTASTPTASRSARRRTTTCSSSAASPKARACSRRSRSPGGPACGSCSPPPRTPYYREKIAPHVDGVRSSITARPTSPAKVKLYGGARALLYPIQAREPFGLVLAEAMACGTPVAALDRGAVREVVDDGVTGIVFDDLDQMAAGLRARAAPSIAGASASARSNVSASSAWSTSTSPCISASWRRTVADARIDAPDLSGRTILAVFAHPDDESLACGGTLARLADAGARVVLLCASRGERGSVSDRSLVARRRAGPAFAPTSCARPRARSASPTCSSTIIPTATCAGPTCPSCTPRSSRPSGAISPTA